MKRHAVTQHESERESVIGTLNVRSKFGHVIKLFVFLHEGIKHEGAHTFAGGVDRWRADRIDCFDVIRKSDDEGVAAIAAAARRRNHDGQHTDDHHGKRSQDACFFFRLKK